MAFDSGGGVAVFPLDLSLEDVDGRSCAGDEVVLSRRFAMVLVVVFLFSDALIAVPAFGFPALTFSTCSSAVVAFGAAMPKPCFPKLIW